MPLGWLLSFEGSSLLMLILLEPWPLIFLQSISAAGSHLRGTSRFMCLHNEREPTTALDLPSDCMCYSSVQTHHTPKGSFGQGGLTCWKMPVCSEVKILLWSQLLVLYKLHKVLLCFCFFCFFFKFPYSMMTRTSGQQSFSLFLSVVILCSSLWWHN